MAKKIVEHKYYIKIYKGVNEVDLQKFDEMIDTVQRATCMQINENKKKLLNKNMILNQNLNMEEMRRDIM